MKTKWVLASAITAMAAIATPVAAQQLSLDFGDGASTSGRIVQLVILLTVLSVAPAILVMITSFTRIVVVLSLLRQSMGAQSSPPNMVLLSLALFLTGFVMMPTFQASYNQGLKPLIENQIDEEEAFTRSVEPFRRFMLSQVRDQDLRLFIDLSNTPNIAAAEGAPLHALIPAFMISELRRAFEIGFLIYLPFLIIDMAVASVLMSMGMMMLPPITISMPFKLVFFVMVDGWYLICGSLVQSFGIVGGG